MTPQLAQITDRFGNVFQYGNAGDYWHPPFDIGTSSDYRTLARYIRDMEIRSDDVLICSYPKSGTHWKTEIVGMLMNKTSSYAKTDFGTYNFLDRVAMSADKLQSPRLLSTHVPFRYIPRQAFQKKIKIIFLDRNPKDLLVSLYNHTHKLAAPIHYPGTFQQFMNFYFECGFYYGHIFDYLMERQEGLEAHPDVEVFTSVFEDTKQDLVGGVKKLNAYLGTGCSDELCEEIAKACSFKELQTYKTDNSTDRASAMFKSGKMQIFRKGDVGDWKNWFTVAMNEEFDAEYNKRMSNYKRTYTYTL